MPVTIKCVYTKQTNKQKLESEHDCLSQPTNGSKKGCQCFMFKSVSERSAWYILRRQVKRAAQSVCDDGIFDEPVKLRWQVSQVQHLARAATSAVFLPRSFKQQG